MEELKVKLMGWLNELFEKAKAELEVGVEKAIEEKCDALVDHLLAKITEAIPGNFDNMLAEKVKPQLKIDAKKFLLEQAEKISDKV